MIIIIGIGLLIAILFGVRIIGPKKAGIVTRFGKPVRYLTSGLNLIIPIIEQVDVQTLATKTEAIRVTGITSDNSACTVGINIVYRVIEGEKTVNDSLYSIENFEDVLTANVEEQARATIVEFEHNEIFQKKGEIGASIQTSLVTALSKYGYEIEAVQVPEIFLDERIMDSMNGLIEAKRNKEAKITDAEAEAEVKRLEGVGMANLRKEIAKGFEDSVNSFKKIDSSLNGARVLDKLIEMSKIDMNEKIGTSKNAKLIFLNGNESSKMPVLTGELVK